MASMGVIVEPLRSDASSKPADIDVDAGHAKGERVREEDIDYARGCAMMADGVPDALVQQAARLAPRTEAAALFGPGEFQRDGWATDPAGKVWTPPDRDTPFEPVRPSTARAEVASGISSTAVPSSSRPT